MSTFLQLVNMTRQEAGLAAGDLTTLQTGLSAESNRIKNWVNREWYRIQSDKDQWQFLRRSGQFVTTAAQFLYSPAQVGAASTPVFAAGDFANWKRDSFRVYKDPQYADEMLSAFMNYDQWRNLYQYASMRTNYSRPVAITVAPDKSLGLGMGPDAVYNVVYEYYAAPAYMAADTDVPNMPPEYHELIVFRALKAYGVFMAATEVIARAQEEIDRIWPKLCGDQLPIFMSGPPLA